MSIMPKRAKAAFQETEQALMEMASSQSTQNVHKFRVSTRRLQTLVEQLLPNQTGSQKKLLKMLDKIRRRAGKVRDIDLQLTALRSVKIPQQPRRKTQLTQGLIELRLEHEKKLRKMLKHNNIIELRKRLRRVAKQMHSEKSRDPLQVARQMLAKLPTAEAMTEIALHQHRVVVKQARYAAEFVPKSPETTAFIAELKRLQDCIGRWHDWYILTNTASKRLGEVSQSPLVAALHNITRGKFRYAISALAAASLVAKPASVHDAGAPSTQKKILTLVARHDSAA
jgi:CHAD domain-containing protein